MRTAHSLVATTIALLMLSGCVPDEGPIIPDPLPSSTPIFASEEEALAAAEEAFAAYIGVVDRILADGGEDSDRLREVATAVVVAQDEVGFEETRALGRHSVGATTFDSASVQQYDVLGLSTEGVVTIYVCEDFGGKDVLNAEGVSVVSPDRRTRWPLVVGFDASTSADLPLIVSSVEDWTGADFCA